MSRPKSTIDDVDQLVEMINLNGPRNQQSSNPKKAAKKARQKARKEEERRLKEEAERAALLAQQRKALEEQLERAARELQQLKLASRAIARKNQAHNQAKENKGTYKDSSSKINAKKGALKVVPGQVSDIKSSCQPAKCTHLCSIHTAAGDHASPVIQGKEDTSKKRRKKKKKKSDEDGLNMCTDTPEEDLYPDFVQDILKSEPVEISTNTVTVKSKKSKKAQKKAGKELVNSNAKSTASKSKSTTTKQALSSDTEGANKSSPFVVNVPNMPTLSLDPGKMTNYLHSGNSHLDWNKFSSGESTTAAPSSAKPEMVTIRRHPTVSDTTVTISIKNQKGEEDILYTLLNGQVVRSKPNTVDIDAFIADEKVASPKTSKRKRNRKKSNKKNQSAPPYPNSSPSVNSVGIVNSKEKDVVICTPVLQPFDPVAPAPTSYQPPQVVEQQPRLPSSFFTDLDDTSEIDLSKLKLPPGITITKVNQPVPTNSSSSSNSNTAETIHSKDNGSNVTSDIEIAPGIQHFEHKDAENLNSMSSLDSQAYNADNESDDPMDQSASKRESMPGKIKRLRARLNRHTCGGERDCHDKRISCSNHGSSDDRVVPNTASNIGWRPSEEALGSAGLARLLCSSSQHQHIISPLETSTTATPFSRLQTAGAKRKQPSSSCNYQTDVFIDSIATGQQQDAVSGHGASTVLKPMMMSSSRDRVHSQCDGFSNNCDETNNSTIGNGFLLNPTTLSSTSTEFTIGSFQYPVQTDYNTPRSGDQ